MLPVTGLQQGPGVQGQPVEVGIDGKIDPSLLPTNYDPAIPAIADEPLQSGDLCYFVNVAGVQKLRKALADDQGTIASCFVKQNAQVGDAVKAYVQGLAALANTGAYTAADVGTILYLSPTVPGSFTATRPTVVGKWIQHVFTVAMVDAAFLYCFFTGSGDPGHSVGSLGIDTVDPIVLTHIQSTANPHATTAAQVGAVPETAVGAAGGVAPLGSDSLLPEANLPITPWKRKKVKALATTQVSIAAPGPFIDGVTMGIDDRLILTGQTAPEENGVYLWKGTGVPLLRADDADTGPRLWAGIWFVTSGSHAGQGWANTNAFVPTIGSTPVVFTGVLGMPAPPSFQNPMTALGDLIVGDVGGAPLAFPVGPDGQVLGVVAGTLAWVTNTAAAHWYIGSGVPGVGLGVDGDSYLNTQLGSGRGDVYLKTAGTWVLSGNILGPAGIAGPAGSTWYNGLGAPSDTLGVDNDYYLDIDTGNVYQKAAGTFSLVGNIKGPAGVAPPMPGPFTLTTAAKTVNPGQTVYWYETLTANRLYGVRVGITGGTTLPNSNISFKLWGDETGALSFTTLMYSGTFTDVLVADVAQGWFYRDIQAAMKLRCSLTNNGAVPLTLQFDIAAEPF